MCTWRGPDPFATTCRPEPVPGATDPTSPSDLTDPGGLPDPYPILPVSGPLDAVVRVPGSKSITNRALVCAALARGTSRLSGALAADDTSAMLGVLHSLGIGFHSATTLEVIEVEGCSGRPPATDAVIDVRQSGTTARFVLPLLALGHGSYRVGAHPQMQARPMGPTFEALRAMGVAVEEQSGAGRLPVTVRGGSIDNRVVRVPGDVSSQFLSGLLLIGPCLAEGMVLEVTTPLVSRPYVDLTVAVMEAFGATVEALDQSTWAVAPGGYRAIDYFIEPDASAASYPLAAAAICGGRVTVDGLGTGSRQGDARFADVLGAMGATVERDASTTTVISTGPPHGGRFDFADISDTAQTVAAVAVFADRPVEVHGIGFIRAKETDRVTAVTTELRRCGIEVNEDADGWTIVPGPPGPSVVHTYQDHRMAMSFALIGLAVPGIQIADPACVAKTFPGYFDLLDRLRTGDGHGGRGR